MGRRWTPEQRAAHAAKMRQLWAEGRFQTPRGPRVKEPPRCVICARREDVQHFNLLKQTRLPDGRHTARGAGSIDLCRQCWQETIAKSGRQCRPVFRRAA